MICISLVTITIQAADVIEPTLDSVMRQTNENARNGPTRKRTAIA